MYEPPSKQGVDTTGYDVINKGSRSAGTTGTQSKLTMAQRQAHRPGTSMDQQSFLEIYSFRKLHISGAPNLPFGEVGRIYRT